MEDKLSETTVKERILQFIRSQKIKRSAFEKKCGLSNSYILKLKKAPTTVKIESIIAAYPEINRDWLLYGEGEMLNSAADERPSFPSRHENDTIALIPSEAEAGSLVGYSEGVRIEDCDRIPNPFPSADIAIRVSGDSMSPDIKSGTLLFVKRINQRAFIPWGNTVVLDTVNGALVKEIYPCEEDSDYIIAKSINPKYPPYKVEQSAILGIFRIIGQSTIHTTM